MIVSKPKIKDSNPFDTISKTCPEKIGEYIDWYSPVDQKGRYLHYDALKYRVPEGLDLDLVWSIVKSARARQLNTLINIGEPRKACGFLLTPTIQKAISETDRNTTNAAVEWMSSKIGEEKQVEYLLNDLVEDEAISSSQLEGACTTTSAAKELLKRKRKPRSIDEKMILGNFRMMRVAWENRHKELSVDLICELHKEGTEGINDEEYSPGFLRQSNNVFVEDGDGDVVHTPPTYVGLKNRIKKIADWVNTCHHDTDSKDYFHPLVKAIVLHFTIGFEHPFKDGNGRVARSLFYWYMFKHDFSAFRYISISVLLKAAPVKYGKSYLYTETDNMDLTYFVEYQAKTILRAISAFKTSFSKTLKDIEEFNKWLWESGLIRQLNTNQQIVFQVAKSGVSKEFSTTVVQENLGCSYNTASKVLNGLVKLKLFTKRKSGREWVFSMLSQDKIQENWKG